MDGRANIVELRVAGPGGQVDSLNARPLPRFEQAYSDHDGTRGETNWIAIDERIGLGS